MHCLLGKKKTKRIEEILKRPVDHALVRGGWEHYWSWVKCKDGSSWWVNYRTGVFEMDRPSPA